MSFWWKVLAGRVWYLPRRLLRDAYYEIFLRRKEEAAAEAAESNRLQSEEEEEEPAERLDPAGRSNPFSLFASLYNPKSEAGRELKRRIAAVGEQVKKGEGARHE